MIIELAATALCNVFISHSRVNSSAAFRLCDELRKRNVETWLDVRDLEPGAEWDQTFEWQQVVDHECYLDPAKPLVPVLIGSPELPGFLKTRQALALTDTAASFEHVADTIVSTLANPASSIDEEKLEIGRKARKQALASFREYSQALAEEDIKRIPIRAVE